MRINSFLLIVLILLAGLVGFFFGTFTQTGKEIARRSEEAGIGQGGGTRGTIIPKVVTLGEQNDSGQVGIATLMEDNGQVKVSINLTNSPQNPQPVHIHSGSCPNPGEVMFPLNNVVDGKSETTIPTTLEQLSIQKPLALNVHKSPSEVNMYVACGNLPD